MAVSLLRVLVLGVIAAAADENVPIKWWGSSPAVLPCVVPDAERVAVRRPPPPLEPEDRSRSHPYVWRHGTHEIRNVSRDGSLTVWRQQDGSSEGLYQCAVSTAGGLVLGYPIHLKFAYMEEEFSAGPAAASAPAGQPVLLRCDIGSGPPARLRWLRDSRPLQHHHRYFTLDNQLLILDVQEGDEGVYSCEATNTVLNVTRASEGARLAVAASAPAPAGLLPVRQREELAVPVGAAVLLPCPLTGWPRPKIIWKVTPAEGRSSELESVEEVLELVGVQVEDEGIYTCAVEGHANLTKSFKVSVTVPAELTVPPSSKQSIRAGTVRFNCTATGRPEPRLTWYKDGTPLLLAGRIVVLPSTDGKRLELLIRSVTSEDAGVYQCVAAGGGAVRSAWARLSVTGAEAGAPGGVRCQPAGAAAVRVHWPPLNATVMAYTVHVNDIGGKSLPGQPFNKTEDIVSVEKPLTPYEFQVRAYVHSSRTNRTIASDLSNPVICQGQGVPIRLVRAGAGVVVSWRQFAEAWPGVRQWVLQARGAAAPADRTLDAHVTNYTVAVPADSPMHFRVLGTRTLPWLQQNLTLVPWTSTAAASDHADTGEPIAAPSNVEVTAVESRKFAVRWRHDEADLSPDTYSYKVCVRKLDGNEQCIESTECWAQVTGLQPASEYSVRVRAQAPPRAGAFSEPIQISTQPEGPQRFKDLTYKLVNASCLRVSWNSAPDEYTVHYTDELRLPVNQWAATKINGNTVLLCGLDLTRELYVMVTGYEPVGHSSIFTIPAQIREAEVQYAAGAGGVRVWWRGAGRRL
ncbi:immunoglobulin superfamily DCC subclass member 3-like, partial [Manduca sexta]|uniref:immunoglobulin superfamily DCC subclass member 3-like n=1 Tax=Manduca sexta TaxID=7130 RepID=UPI00189079DA